MVSNIEEAENLLALSMLKRSTAATNANEQSRHVVSITLFSNYLFILDQYFAKNSLYEVTSQNISSIFVIFMIVSKCRYSIM